MLQINSGKFFAAPEGEWIVLPQRAELYTNYATPAPIETAFGTLTPAGDVGGVSRLALTYESRLERDPRSPGFQIAATDQAPYVADVAAVLAVALDIVCTPDPAAAVRLTQGGHDAPAGRARRLIPRVFEANVPAAAGDAARLAGCVTQLLGLPRASYRPVIRAVRRVASAVHHAADDPEIAYLMLVAAVEALAQRFSSRPITWTDYDGAVRDALDGALADVNAASADAVRAALLATAHLKLKQKYVQFACEHLEPAFFRAEADGRAHPARRSDVRALFAGAYDLRSGHVHALDELPREVTAFAQLGEVVATEDGITWSIGGLHRATRHVLASFIGSQPQVPAEAIAYRDELPGVIRVGIASQHWIGDATRFDHETARRYLAAFWGELLQPPHDGGAVTDLSEVTEKIERLVKGLTPEHRVPMLVLYALYHCTVAASGHRPAAQAFLDRYQADLERPVVENVALHVYLDEQAPWPADAVERVYRDYVTRRHRRGAFRLPDALGVAVLLHVAEQRRAACDLAAARARIAEAVEEMPGVAALRELETLDDDALRAEPLPWRARVLPTTLRGRDHQGTATDGN